MDMDHLTKLEIVAVFKVSGKKFITPGLTVLRYKPHPDNIEPSWADGNRWIRISDEIFNARLAYAKLMLANSIKTDIKCYKKAVKTKELVFKRSKGRTLRFNLK